MRFLASFFTPPLRDFLDLDLDFFDGDFVFFRFRDRDLDFDFALPLRLLLLGDLVSRPSFLSFRLLSRRFLLRDRLSRAMIAM